MLVGGQKASSAGVSVTSKKERLEVLKTHYRHLGSCSVDSAFDDSWKEEVDEQVSECSSVSKAYVERHWIKKLRERK